MIRRRPVDVRGADDEIHLQVRRERIPAAAIALRRKDTYRLKQDITLPGSKPVIERMPWTEMKLAGCQAKPADGQIHLEGTLMVFAPYEGGESGMVQCGGRKAFRFPVKWRCGVPLRI